MKTLYQSFEFVRQHYVDDAQLQLSGEEIIEMCDVAQELSDAFSVSTIEAYTIASAGFLAGMHYQKERQGDEQGAKA